jgi:hypothetical protein
MNLTLRRPLADLGWPRSARAKVVAGAGLATFFFGFGAAAALNLYLIHVRSPLVLTLRSSLSYKSSIFGDGLLLPCLNMIVASFLIENRLELRRRLLLWAVAVGAVFTAYFHISQAVDGIVNWAMPTPWHWNLLGAWHAVYMMSVATLLALFYILGIRLVLRGRRAWGPLLLVTAGVTLFFVLLRLDYHSVRLESMLPHTNSHTQAIADAAESIARRTLSR